MRKIDARSQENKQKAPGNRAPHNLQTSSLVPLAQRGRQFGVCVCIAHLAEHENGVTGAPAATSFADLHQVNVWGDPAMRAELGSLRNGLNNRKGHTSARISGYGAYEGARKA